MKTIVFDTETTKLPFIRPWAKPHIVQLSYIVITHNVKLDNVKLVDNVIALPEDIDLPESSVAIHGVTRLKMREFGVPIEQALHQFQNDMSGCELVICHNYDFDVEMLTLEGNRCNIDMSGVNSIPSFCTMQDLTHICKLPRKGTFEFKYPTLAELHNHFFHTIPHGLHNSLADSILCYRCFMMYSEGIDIIDWDSPIRPHLLQLV